MERLIAVYFPITHKIIVTPAKKIASLVAILVFSLLFYSLNLTSVGSESDNSPLDNDNNTDSSDTPQHHYSVSECVPLAHWHQFTAFMTVADTCITIFIPFASICVINTFIAIKLAQTASKIAARKPSKSTKSKSSSVKFYNSTQDTSQRVHFKSSELVTTSRLFATTNRHTTIDKSKYTLLKASAHLNKRKKRHTRATFVLLSISTSFLVFNFPLALDKIVYLLRDTFPPPVRLNNSSFNEETDVFSLVDPLEHLLNELTTKLHYFNFVMNFFLYSLSGTKFRKAVLRLFALAK